MKKIFFLCLATALLLTSCEKTPEADFYTDTIEPVVGHEVFFTNNSHNAKQFDWDFGDGFGSSEENPVHIFTGTGTFEVTLTVTSKNGLTDQASLTLEVLIPTLLEIEVREWYDEYTVGGASVYLFTSITDWDAAVNEIAQGFTDANGLVVFSGLDPFVYYVDVWEQNHDNYTLRNEDVGFIRTPEILPNHINRFVAWVDYVEHGKGSGREGRKAVIKKLERKPQSRLLRQADGDTSGWEELYKRSIKIK